MDDELSLRCAGIFASELRVQRHRNEAMLVKMVGTARVRIGIICATALVIAPLTWSVGAESGQFSALVTEIYPAIVAHSLIFDDPPPIAPNPQPNGQPIDTEASSNGARSPDYAGILSRQFIGEVERRQYDLTDMMAQGLVRDMNFRTHFLGVAPPAIRDPDRHDLHLMGDYGKSVLREAADETIQEVGWLDTLENRLKSLFKYELFVEGTENKEYTNREFAWEDRKDKIRQQETTAIQVVDGSQRRYEAHYGLSLLNIETSSDAFVTPLSAYARWENLPIAGKVKLKIQPLQEVSLKVRNSINKMWYWQNSAFLDEAYDPKVRFSVTRRDEIRRNRIAFFTEFGEHAQVGIMFGVLL